MNQGRTVFSQLLSFLPDREFRRCVARYDGDARPRGFSCWDQYLSMAFAQLTYRDGLRDIEACLRSLGGKLYHMGFHGRVARSTLADANDSHDWRIYADFAQVLTSANLLELYLCMIPALPMQYEAYCLAFTRGDDLFQRDTKEAFLVLWQTVRIVPEYGEIPREGQQFPFLRVGEWVLATLLQRHKLGFNLRLRGQRLVPAAF